MKDRLEFGIGGDESSPDEEEEDSTLKCSGTAWSGSDSAPRHRSSSTSDFSSSSSSEEEAEGHNRPSHKSCRPTEGLLLLHQEFVEVRDLKRRKLVTKPYQKIFINLVWYFMFDQIGAFCYFDWVICLVVSLDFAVLLGVQWLVINLGLVFHGFKLSMLCRKLTRNV